MSPMGHASRVEPRDCLSNPAPENFQGRVFYAHAPNLTRRNHTMADENLYTFENPDYKKTY